jgi:protein-disulfide isomerase
METMSRASSTQGFNDMLAARRAFGNTPALSTLPAVRDRDHVTGSNSPRLTLVEYGDFGCPYCFDGLRLVWRHSEGGAS